MILPLGNTIASGTPDLVIAWAREVVPSEILNFDLIIGGLSTKGFRPTRDS
ncbi:MAG: hypothetical protein R3275_13700 [Saprospiraceae bacterium]|nr:hypothetical protein [Saprospiraceae bacterium]